MNCSTLLATVASITIAVTAAPTLAGDDCPHHGPAVHPGGYHASGIVYSEPAEKPQPTTDSIRTPGNKFPLPLSPEAIERREKQSTGTLAIRAVQGTPGGPPIASADVEVQLYHRGMLVETIAAELDEHGVVMLEGMPIAMGLQPVVLINHADLTYQKVGELMDRDNPQQSIEIVCYEPTDQQPPWKVRMRHVMVAAERDGLHVTEVMMVENTGERTWTGQLVDGIERPVTTVFPLPKAAIGVTLGRGFHDWCCTTLKGDGLANHLPIMPGATEMIYSYIIPARRGSATFEIIAPYAPGGVDHVMVLVPTELETTSVAGLQVSGDGKMGAMPVRQYVAANIQGGETMTLSVSGLITSGDSAFATAGFAKTAAGIGIITVVIIALWMIFAKPVKKQPAVQPQQAGA